MSEIDPWALPQPGPVSGPVSGPVDTAGIPQQHPAYAYPVASYPLAGPLKPLSLIPAIIVMTLGALYVIASIAEIFVINSQLSLINTFNADIAGGTVPDNAVAQAQASDSHINTGSWIATGIYFAALISIIVWERQLKSQLGSLGARRAVFAKAGYTYFRATWVLSFALGLFLTSQSNNNDINSLQDVTNHDHELMLYFGLRALLGAALIFFAYRLMKMSQEGIHRLLAAAQR
ncbi:hypothetical protein KDL01_35050 [Actinospica durhamensis]|uniref:Uncharacterized protein n=1 Tax=Actinospica durhamensis TaxID=1508375 RepID=A0A941EWF0_9ACTN|nr:hypothetical protein [Actinospica durhamensis]MBR7838538.1 hypothetical protein [Actinospica durhamensis]